MATSNVGTSVAQCLAPAIRRMEVATLPSPSSRRCCPAGTSSKIYNRKHRPSATSALPRLTTVSMRSRKVDSTSRRPISVASSVRERPDAALEFTALHFGIVVPNVRSLNAGPAATVTLCPSSSVAQNAATLGAPPYSSCQTKSVCSPGITVTRSDSPGPTSPTTLPLASAIRTKTPIRASRSPSRKSLPTMVSRAVPGTMGASFSATRVDRVVEQANSASAVTSAKRRERDMVDPAEWSRALEMLPVRCVRTAR